MSIRTSWILALVLVAGVQCTNDDESAERERTDEAVSRSPAPAPAPPALAPAPHEAPDEVAGTSSAPPLGSCTGPAGRTLRTLIVGNSQIYYWQLPDLLSDLSRSAPPECPRIEAEGFTRGGQNLRRLWEGGDSKGRTLVPTLEAGRYDVVVISESIDLIELPPPHAQFVQYANLIIHAARATGAVPVLYASPYPDQEDHYGFVEMAEPQLALGRARAVTVAAAGLAWLRVWETLPLIDLHHTDHSHPGFKGSVISAMVLYAALTRATPVGLRPSPEVRCAGAACPALTPVELDVFERAAWDEARASAFELE